MGQRGISSDQIGNGGAEEELLSGGQRRISEDTVI